MDNFRNELTQLLNRHSRETVSDTPDLILANYMLICLSAFESAVVMRASWNSSKYPVITTKAKP